MTRKWLVIDTHNHYLSHEVLEQCQMADGMDYQKSVHAFRYAYEEMKSIEKTVALMDEAGCDMAVLNQAAWSPMGLTVCRAINDSYAKAVKNYPGRFIGCAHVPPDSKKASLDELDRAVTELGLKGLAIVSSTSDVTLDSEELFPLYEKVAALDIPVVVHPSTRAPVWGGAKYKMSYHVSREYDVAKGTVEVMFGVLPRFPELRFLMPHHGGGMPALKGRIKAWFEPEDWPTPEEFKNRPKTPRELIEFGLDEAFENIFGKVYFDTAGFGGWMPITRSATDSIRADRLCFGTDYPFEIHEARDVRGFIDNIKALDISDEDKAMILGGTAKELFRV